jgi:hypothetical protein
MKQAIAAVMIAVALLGTAGATSAADACIGRGPLICC